MSKLKVQLNELEKTLIWAKTRRSRARETMNRNEESEGLRQIWIHWDRIVRALSDRVDEMREERREENGNS